MSKEAETTTEVTRLLSAWQKGDPKALEALTPLIYHELRNVAAAYLRRERKDHTLQPTALVNEAFLRLAGIESKDWRNRAHFFAIAARIMRQLLVEHARKTRAQKRGGDQQRVPAEDAWALGHAPDEDLLNLDDALTELARTDERKGRVIELRYFGGLEIEEIAEVTSTSVATVGRDVRVGLAWLNRYLSSTVSPSTPARAE